MPFAKYTNLDTAIGVSGIYFDGMFPSGIHSGKLVALGFPFETIYTQDIRNQLMGKILSFFNIPSGVHGGYNRPEDFILNQNYPNPFNPSTMISYQLPFHSQVQQGNGSEVNAGIPVLLKVYDMLGREVTTLVNEEQLTGNHSVNFNASHLASGTYFYHLVAGSYSSVKKMILLK